MRATDEGGHMKVALGIIGVFTLLIVTAMLKDLFWPVR